MFFPIPNPFSSKARRVAKSGSTDSLDRPYPKKGFASILKRDEEKFVQETRPVSNEEFEGLSIRMRGIF